MLDCALVRTCWLITTGLLLLAPADPCKQTGLREFSNRREGCNVRQNALVDFKLIGLHSGFQHFGSRANLQVGFFVPSSKDGSNSITVQAVEVQDLFQYFMQSKDSIPWREGAWNVFKPWPTKDVIDFLGLQPENIGVVAFYKGGNGQPVFLPVNVALDDRKPVAHKYTFRFVNGQNLQAVDLALTNSSGLEVSIHKPDLNCRPKTHPGCILSAGGNALTFDLDMSALPEGSYRLKLVGHTPSGSTSSTEVLFYHHS